MRNEMMHRPVVKPELVAFMREKQKQLPGELGEIEQAAHEKEVPIIPHETVVFCSFIGTASAKEIARSAQRSVFLQA